MDSATSGGVQAARNQATQQVLGNAYHKGGRIDEVISRVRGNTVQLEELAYKLREHADAVHGSVPEDPSKSVPTPVRGAGLINQLDAAIDDLENALSFVAVQAGRNSTLA